MFRRVDPDASLILLHIPKTAGTTLAIILMNRYGQDRTRAVTGGHAGRERFTQEPEATRGGAALYIGHQAFGLHEHIPGACEYVTILRDPVARVVSHYYHVLHEPTHYLHKRVVDRGMTLEQYAENPFRSHELDNGQTRMLADFRLNRSQPIGKSERSLLPSALENLEGRFCCVGLTERFDESMVMLSDSLGWERVPPYLPARVSASKPKSPLEPAVSAKIREANALDVELYDRVLARFEARVQAQGVAFGERVEAVRCENEHVREQVEAQKQAAAAE